MVVHQINNMASSPEVQHVDLQQGKDNQVLLKLVTLASEFADMKVTIQNIETSMNNKEAEYVDNNKKIKDLKSKLNGFETDITELRNDLAILHSEVSKLKRVQSSSHENSLHVEGQSRRNNLILDGIGEVVRETDADSKEQVHNIIENKLGLVNARQIKIARAHRLPTGPTHTIQGRPHPVIFKLHWYGDREHIWNASGKLKDTRIFLSEDFPAGVKQRGNILLPIMKAARAQGKRSSLSVDKLFIEGTEYTINCLDKLPSELDPKHIATRTDGKVTAFFSSASPLSNFHPAKITNDNGTVSDNVEQKIRKIGQSSYMMLVQ